MSRRPPRVLVADDQPDVLTALGLLLCTVREFPQDMQKRDKLWIRHFSMVQRLLE